MLADALGILSRELDNGSDLLQQMRQQLMGEAEMPPREVQGVGQEFLDGKTPSTGDGQKRALADRKWFSELDRVSKKSLKPEDTCPICSNPFLEGTLDEKRSVRLVPAPCAYFIARTDPYPLVVRLPCHKDHKFDLECIAPWLRLHATCPLDRKNLIKKKEPPPPSQEEEDGEYDDYYA